MKKPTNRHARGFTLLELMIAGVIVALLASLALPGYRSYVLRSNRAVARGALIDLAAKEEVVKLQTQSYTGNTSDLVGVGSSSYYIDRSGSASATATSSSIYKISLTADTLASNRCVTSASTGAFALVATPVAGSPQAQDTACTSLCISSTGLHGFSPAPTQTGADLCWVQ